MRHLMIDIETLGNTPNAAILAIGGAFFDIETGEVERGFHHPVSFQSCVEQGMEVNEETMVWWLKENPEFFASLVLRGYGRSINEALIYLNRQIEHYKPEAIWSRGPSFDLAILSNAYDKTDLMKAWDFRSERCVRTMKMLAPEIKEHTPFRGTKHDPGADCKHQIKYVCEIYKYIKR